MTTRASRRQFLKTASLVSLAGAASPLALNLAAIGAASAQAAPAYRAIVCLFLNGGNDHSNTFIPYDQPSYDQYFAARDSIAIARDQLTPTATAAVASQGGRQFAFHPSLTGFKTLWDQGKLAVVANVGPLVTPTTKTQYNNRSVPLPPKLFSHNDQQTAWQADHAAGEGARLGWGGRVGDILAGQNTNALFTCISASGSAVYLSGNSVLQYQVSSSGAISISSITGNLFGSTSASAGYRSLLTRSTAGANLVEDEIGVITNRSITANDQLRTALPAASTLVPAIPANNGLASQLSVVARIIAARGTLGTSRQVFFVSIGGFDSHDFLLTQHVDRMNQVNAAVNAFYAWLVQMSIQDQVTVFTASDFGRTLTSNGDGSDHGWGSHHFVVGGSVLGGEVYGSFIPTTFGTSVDVGQGSMIPGLAVDQYAATFARWLGVSDTDVPLILPNVGNFGTSRYLPFI
ncbi:MAG TPA: DUF1501 domain-containing protein [Burkholderiales bacterium]|nr:DUF1501 domain-containing protein [Burkholderiales bacterium]